MHRSPRAVWILLVGALVCLTAACQSAPSQLYVLSADTGSPAGTPDAPPKLHAWNSGTMAATSASRPIRLGVSVIVPEYLDRTDIVRRTGENELTTSRDAQWGESLSVDAARVLSEDLAARLPAVEVMMLPSRGYGPADYEVQVELTRFDSNIAGTSTAAGWWRLRDATNREVVGSRIEHTEHATGQGYAAMAAAMSRNLSAISVGVAAAVEDFIRPAKADLHRTGEAVQR
jgi:uncharacterized protein